MEQHIDPEPTKRGWTASIPIAVAVLLLVALLGVPGFVLGLYCRATADTDSAATLWMVGFENPTLNSFVENPALRIFLTPACMLAGHSRPIARFYNYQLQLTKPHILVLSGPFRGNWTLDPLLAPTPPPGAK